MCQFFDQLPKHSKSSGQKKRNLLLTMKPCADEKTYYRFRLLAFTSDGKNDRDYPWIQRFVHTKWGVHPEKGYPIIEDEITCPVTPHVHVEGNRYNACKMCDAANKYFIQFKESGWKDKEACKKNKEFGRKLEYIIPVYVVTDPNYEGNQGKLKVIMFNDKKFYEDFKSRVEKASMKNHVFNGTNAVDCCMHVSEVREVKNEGQPNEYVWKHKVIDKIVFSNKPYDIPSITKEVVANMGFDEEYYTSSTPEEINAFYKKYCTVSNDDIPMDDTDIPVYDSPKTTPPKTDVPKVEVTNTNVTNDDVDTSELEELTSELDGDTPSSSDVDSLADVPKSSETSASSSSDASSKEIDDLLDGIDL